MKAMTLTTHEAKVIALGWEIRLAEQGKELWYAIDHDLLAAGASLFEKGWLHCRISDEGVPEFRLTDQGLQTLRTDTIRQAHTTPN